MIALLAALATAAPVQADLDATLGMRAGGSALVTVAPVPHLEVGGLGTGTTDVYAGAPSWVRSGLEPAWNLHLAPMAAVGWSSGDTPVSLAVHGAAGLELSTFRETRVIPALEEPVVYGATGVRFSGGLLTTLRIRPVGPGANLQLFVPLPPMATGAVDVVRLHLGLGISLGPRRK